MRRLLVLAALALAACGTEPRPVAAPADGRQDPPLRVAASGRPSPQGTLYLAGREPGTLIRVDAAANTATTHHVPQLGGGDPPFMVAYTGGRVVVFALGQATSLAADLTDPRPLGESWFFIPSQTPGRVWNILLRKGDPATIRRFRGLREVTVAGETTFARHVPLPGWPVAAIQGGLVIERDGLELWNPRTAKSQPLPGSWLIAARGELVASCGQPCSAVYLTNVRTGRRQTIRHRNGIRGAFSPDGRLLAVMGEHAETVVIDLATRRVTTLQPRQKRHEYAALAWSTDNWLFYNAGRGRLAAWREGERPRRLPMKVGPFISMAAD